MQWVQFKFNPYVCLYPRFGELWGTRQIQLILQAITDNSDLDTTDEEERWIRWTVIIRILNAFIFPIAVDTDDIPDVFGMFKIYKSVKKVQVDMYLSPYNPPVPDPSLPGVVLVETAVREEIDGSAVVAVESN